MTWQWTKGCGWIGMLMGPPVDHTITDPPYAEYVYTNSRRTRTGPNKAHDLEHSWLSDAQIEFACLAIASRTIRWGIVFNDIEIGIPRWRAGLERHGMRYIGTGIWHKEPYTPQMTGDRAAQNYEAYLIMHSASPTRWNGGGLGSCVKYPPAPSVNGRHPTEKPVDLIEHLVRMYTDRGETIADPFGGRATVPAVAVQCGRNAVGWEIGDKHYENGLIRLENTNEKIQLLTDEQMIHWYGRPAVTGGKTQKLFSPEQLENKEESCQSPESQLSIV